MKSFRISCGVIICLLFCVNGFAKGIPGEWTLINNGYGEGLFVQLNTGGTGKARAKLTRRALAVSKAAGSQRKGTFRATGGYYFIVDGEVSCPITWTKKGDTLIIRKKGSPTKNVSARLDVESSSRDLSDEGGYRNSVIAQWKRDLPSNEDVKKYKFYLSESLDLEYGPYLNSFLTGKYILQNDKLFPLHRVYGEAEKNIISPQQLFDSVNNYSELERITIQVSPCVIDAFRLAGNDSEPTRSDSVSEIVKDIERYHSCISAVEQLNSIPWKDFPVTEDGLYFTFTEKTTRDIYYLSSAWADENLKQTVDELHRRLDVLEQSRLSLNERYKEALFSTLENMSCHEVWYIQKNSRKFFKGAISKNDIEFAFPILDYNVESCDVLESENKTLCQITLIVGSKKKYQLELTGYADGHIDPLSFRNDKAVDLGKVKLTPEQKQKLKKAKSESTSALLNGLR